MPKHIKLISQDEIEELKREKKALEEKALRVAKKSADIDALMRLALASLEGSKAR